MQLREFVAYVQEHPGATQAVLAARYGVSERTVRTYVQQANDALAGVACIELERGHGYTLSIDHLAAYDAWRADTATPEHPLPQTPQERVAYLLNDLLSRTDWITLDAYSEMLFASRSVLSGDIKQVEKTLESFGLALVKRPRYGMRVEGPEMARRLCLAAVMMHDVDAEMPEGKAGVVRQFASSGKRHILQSIAENVDRAVEAHGFHINEVAYQNLLVHIAVAIMRIKAGQYVPIESDQLKRIMSSNEYAIAAEIARAIEREAEVELPEEEVAYIAIHLAGKQTIWSPSEEADSLVVTDEVWDVVGQMLDRVWQVFRFDFRNDLELRMNLARHVAPLAVRLQYHMDLKNPLLSDIKSRYLLAWSIAVEASSVLGAQYGTQPSEDETGYLALTFALALERQQAAPAKKRILVVCASGAGSARLLEHRCRKEFGAYVERIQTCDVMHLDSVDFTQVDYVFTTVPLGRILPVPVREVTYFFDDAEAADVRELLASSGVGGALARYFDQRLFFPQCTLRTKDEVLEFLCERACATRTVDQRLGELVQAREELAATSFGNNVAMPHPLEPVSDETFIAVALLQTPVTWNEQGTKVQAVFLISFARDAGHELDDLFSKLADLFIDEQAIARLVAEQTWSCLMRLIGALDTGAGQPAGGESAAAGPTK